MRSPGENKVHAGVCGEREGGGESSLSDAGMAGQQGEDPSRLGRKMLKRFCPKKLAVASCREQTLGKSPGPDVIYCTAGQGRNCAGQQHLKL